MFGLVLWCLTPLSTIFQLFRGGQFLMVEETDDPEKSTDLQSIQTYSKYRSFLFARVVQKM
jgi:hypothetical protein